MPCLLFLFLSGQRASKNPGRKHNCPIPDCKGNVTDLERHYLSCHNGSIPRNLWHTLRKEQKHNILKKKRDIRAPKLLSNGLTVWEQMKKKHPELFNLVCPRCGRRLVYLKSHIQKYHTHDGHTMVDTAILIENARTFTDDMPHFLDDIIARYHNMLLTNGKSKSEANSMSCSLKMLFTYLGATQDIGYLLLAIQSLCENDAKKLTSTNEFKQLFKGDELAGIHIILSCLDFLKGDELDLPGDMITDASRHYMARLNIVKSKVNKSNDFAKIPSVIKKKKRHMYIL